MRANIVDECVSQAKGHKDTRVLLKEPLPLVGKIVSGWFTKKIFDKKENKWVAKDF